VTSEIRLTILKLESGDRFFIIEVLDPVFITASVEHFAAIVIDTRYIYDVMILSLHWHLWCSTLLARRMEMLSPLMRQKPFLAM
jgi:hypothetical protein